MRIAVAGLGFMGATHVKAIRSLSGVTLAAVCSSDEKKLAGDLSSVGGNIGAGERFDFSAIQRYRSLEELFRDPEIDAVDLCLPTYLHPSAAITALEAGKHVLVEKPFALDEASCGHMIDAARSAGKVLMAAQVLRFFPSYQALMSALPELGHVRSAVFRRRCAVPGWGDWLKDKSRSGGGVFDLLIHDVDMCLRLFGMPDSVSACGFEDLSAGIDLIDARLHYGERFVASVIGGWHPGAFPFSMEYAVVASGGAVEYSSDGKAPTLYAAGGTQKLPLAEADGYASEIAYFAECCRTGNAPDACTPEESAEAVRITRLMSAARARNGERISCK